MSIYIRPKVTGATVFFTVCLADRSSTLLVDHIAVLREAVRNTRAKHPFQIIEWVTLPDHIHCIWRMPDGDRDYGKRWGSIKGQFTRKVRRPALGPAPTHLPVIKSGRFAGLKPGLRANRRECDVWQRRFWGHHVRDDRGLANHIQYIHTNPVKHGLVEQPTDWPYSSIHRAIRLGQSEWT